MEDIIMNEEVREDEVIRNEDEILETDEESMVEFNDYDIPDDIQEAEDRCHANPIAIALLGGIALGGLAYAGFQEVRKRINRIRVKDTIIDLTEELEGVEDEEPAEEETDDHPEISSEEAKNLLKPESRRSRNTSKRKLRRKNRHSRRGA